MARYAANVWSLGGKLLARSSTSESQLPGTNYSFSRSRTESTPGFSFSFLDRIPPSGGNGIPGEISLNFGNSDRKGFLNSKNEISLHSDRNFGFSDRNFGNFDRNFGFVTVK